VPVAATLEEFLGHIVGEKPRPDTSQPLRKSVYTKSSAWSYEEEWRILGIPKGLHYGRVPPTGEIGKVSPLQLGEMFVIPTTSLQQRFYVGPEIGE